jgi:S-adenosylmethionine:tRNA ribosyltransferase-isomerase
MVVDKGTGCMLHRRFSDLPGFLKKGDLLILNDTKVFQARLYGKRPTGGKVEVLLIRQSDGRDSWQCLARPGGLLKKGDVLSFGPDTEARVVARDEDGFFIFSFSGPSDFIERYGHVPLPPYIRRHDDEEDRLRYQTVFAREEGAVAAPTAGLHFTEALIEEIRGKGVDVHYITLHTGPGTFMPVRSQDIRRHRMPSEPYSIRKEAFDAFLEARARGGRVIATGSTSLRALEASVLEGIERPLLKGETGLFIYPGFSFKAVTALITNFHLPKSTLLMLVSAFAGAGLIKSAYEEAIKERYRFYSYGDAMLII